MTMTAMRLDPPTLIPTRERLLDLVRAKHDGDLGRCGWATRLRLKFAYFTPEEIYEATVDRLVKPETTWLDVGCGRNLLPSNPALARALAGRCARLVGVDPDPTIQENTFVHERFQEDIGHHRGRAIYDLITLRMVAEHVTDPAATAAQLAELTRSAGKVVIYTINRWSPVSQFARWIPFRLHHPIKRLLWKTEERDTFPVAYRMNTRRKLRALFEGRGFREVGFAHLDDCRTFAGIRPLLHLELWTRRCLNAVGLGYPENCLLGVYERLPAPEPTARAIPSSAREAR